MEAVLRKKNTQIYKIWNSMGEGLSSLSLLHRQFSGSGARFPKAL